MTQTNKFKVGDKVRCIDDGGNSYITVGKEYIVDEVYSSGEVRTSCNNVGEYFIYENELFELVEEPKVTAPNKRHIHADLIISWANGAIVEYKSSTGLWLETENPWWDEDTEFRIKPEPKPDAVKYMGFEDAKGGKDDLFPDCAVAPKHGWVSHWQYQLKLTFCGETGKLKAAEVINQD